MNCEIIAVGTEILLGEIVNTDAQMISQGLCELGINTYFQTVCGDNAQRLRSALEIAKSRADIIITTGGLGPTADDLTKETIAAVFGRELVLHEGSMERLRENFKGREMTQNNIKQAYLPQGCDVLENDWGTAPGCAFKSENTHVLMLPGPPSECEPMFKLRAVPYLKAMQGGAIESSYIKIFGMGESAMEAALAEKMNAWKNPTAAPYAKEGECLVRVTARAETVQSAREMLAPAVAELCADLGDVVYGVDVESLEQVVVEQLISKKLTLATAESCTGGMIGARLTNVAGASQCYLGGIISYTNGVKRDILNVEEGTLAEFGAVSAQTAKEMAAGAKSATGADFALSVTGVAGPDASEGKPVGTIFIGLATCDGVYAFKMKRTGKSRTRNRRMAAMAALDILRREIFEIYGGESLYEPF